MPPISESDRDLPLFLKGVKNKCLEQFPIPDNKIKQANRQTKLSSGTLIISSLT